MTLKGQKMRYLVVLLMVFGLALVGGCAEQGQAAGPKLEAWGLLSQNSEMGRLGVRLGEGASVGAVGAWQDDRTIMVGGYAVLDVGEPAKLTLPNPFDPVLPLELTGQLYIGGQMGAAFDLDHQRKTMLCGGPLAGVRIVQNKWLEVGGEYQYRLAEGDPNPLSGWPMHSVVMFSARILVP